MIDSYNSTVTVSIEDTNGKEYEFSVDSENYDCFRISLQGSLKNSLIKNANESLENEYKLDEVDAERTARIENVKVGDSVFLEMHGPEIKMEKYDDDEYEFRSLVKSYIDVKTKTGSVGILDSYVYDALKHYVNNEALEVKAVVSSVTPLSKRDRRSRRALISISVEILPKETGQKYIFNQVSGLVKFIKESLFFDDGDMGYPVDGALEQLEEDTKEFEEELLASCSSIDDIVKVSVSIETFATGDYMGWDEEDYDEEEYDDGYDQSISKYELNLKTGEYSES